MTYALLRRARRPHLADRLLGLRGCWSTSVRTGWSGRCSSGCSAAATRRRSTTTRSRGRGRRWLARAGAGRLRRVLHSQTPSSGPGRSSSRSSASCQLPDTALLHHADRIDVDARTPRQRTSPKRSTRTVRTASRIALRRPFEQDLEAVLLAQPLRAARAPAPRPRYRRPRELPQAARQGRDRPCAPASASRRAQHQVHEGAVAADSPSSCETRSPARRRPR